MAFGAGASGASLRKTSVFVSGVMTVYAGRGQAASVRQSPKAADGVRQGILGLSTYIATFFDLGIRGHSNLDEPLHVVV